MAEFSTGDELARDLDSRQRQLETLERLSQRFGASLSSALTKSTADGKQLDGVLASIGQSLSSATLKSALSTLQTALKGGFEDLVKGFFASPGVLNLAGAGLSPFAKGGVIAQGMVTPFASGGVVASPTYFPLQRGTGLMGERGAEAIMPLARGPDGRLGVRAAGAGERPVTVTVNIATPDADSFRRSEAQVSAALARAVARGRRAL